MRIEKRKRKAQGGWIKVIIHHSSFIIGCALAAGIAGAQPFPSRAVVSGPPAPKPTTTRTGRDGYDCALAMLAASAQPMMNDE